MRCISVDDLVKVRRAARRTVPQPAAAACLSARCPTYRSRPPAAAVAFMQNNLQCWWLRDARRRPGWRDHSSVSPSFPPRPSPGTLPPMRRRRRPTCKTSVRVHTPHSTVISRRATTVAARETFICYGSAPCGQSGRQRSGDACLGAAAAKLALLCGVTARERERWSSLAEQSRGVVANRTRTVEEAGRGIGEQRRGSFVAEGC